MPDTAPPGAAAAAAPEPPATLSVSDLTLHYGQSQILFGVSLEARVGEVTAVMGTNGVGKTSLLKALAGRHPYTDGRLAVDGTVLDHPSATRAAWAGIAYVPQGREVFPLLSVTENLETAFACLPPAERHVPDRIYELFPVLREMAQRRGGDLSGGQQQQLAIARALVTRPRVLLLDEPTEGIQPNIIKQIGTVIEALRAEGEMAIVLVEQYFDFAWTQADRFVAMSRGKVTLSDAKANVQREELLSHVSI
ncbi:urea ABC transporter ATP-binding subunit UrtE [Rhodosalinus sp.]|uniref:urea ABC transporter ATP-binding subunit UrtE n=1 Tax=Rhodosalinus sp. TaxID=2047741 RepID=UPI00356A6DF0